MGPDVDGLVVHLEAAEEAVQRRALWVPVARDDAVLPEHLRTEHTPVTAAALGETLKKKTPRRPVK